MHARGARRSAILVAEATADEDGAQRARPGVAPLEREDERREERAGREEDEGLPGHDVGLGGG